MNHLPSINVEFEGWDTWLKLLDALDGFGVTLSEIDGTDYAGFLKGVKTEDGDECVCLQLVDSGWEQTGVCVLVQVNYLRAITVH